MSVDAGSTYMTLQEAADLLGVHPTTLRRWSDCGDIDCLRTPGGHRRFRQKDVVAFLARMGQVTPKAPPVEPVQDLMSRALEDLSWRGMMTAEPWWAGLDEDHRAVHRERGRRLLGLAIQHTLQQADRAAILEEGRCIGKQYGQEAAHRSLSLVDTVSAVLFFRETLIRAARPGLFVRGQYDDTDVYIHRSLRIFLDQVLFAVLEGYEQAMRALLSPEETG